MSYTVGDISKLLQKYGAIMAPMEYVNGNQEFVVLYSQTADIHFEYYLVLLNIVGQEPEFVQKRGKSPVFKTPGELVRSSSYYLRLQWGSAASFGFKIPSPALLPREREEKKQEPAAPKVVSKSSAERKGNAFKFFLSPETVAKIAAQQGIKLEAEKQEAAKVKDDLVAAKPHEIFYRFRGTVIWADKPFDVWGGSQEVKQYRLVKVYMETKEGLLHIVSSNVPDTERIFHTQLMERLEIRGPVFIHP